MSIYTKLMAVQNVLKVPKLRNNNFGNYQYRSCADILEQVKPILNDSKLLLTISDDIILISDKIFVKATASLWDTESKDHIKVDGFAQIEPRKGIDAAQLTGSASSYARKYALNGLFCIDDSKDPDSLPPPTSVDIKCSACGGTITEVTNSSTGQTETPEQFARISGGLCLNCYLKRCGGK